MNVRLQRLALLVAGSLVGGVLWIAVWGTLQPKPYSLSEADRQALRILLDANRSERGLYLFDEELGYRFKPDFRGIRHQTANAPHVTNSRGLLGSRDVHPGDGHRVLVLGDSVAYGDGVAFEDTFSEKFQESVGKGIRVFSAACPGWRTEQALRHFARDLSDSRWDTVVLTVSLNDLVAYRWTKLANGEYKMTVSLAEPARGAATLAQLRAKFGRGHATRPLKDHDDATLLAWSDREWDRYLEDVLEPFVDAEERPRLVIVMFPSLYQLQALERGVAAEEALHPQSRMAQFTEARGLGFIDVSNAFRGLGENRLGESFRDYLHFTESGHSRVAQQLLRELGPQLQQAQQKPRFSVGSPPSGPVAKRPGNPGDSIR